MNNEAVNDYRESLIAMRTPSKPEITALTIVAEDQSDFAPQIVSCIEDYLKSASARQKLIPLYLLDSICKNYPDSRYVKLFTQNIVSNFHHVLENSSEAGWLSLLKLRNTWFDTKIFPEKKLLAIDRRAREIVREWPDWKRVEERVKNPHYNVQNQQQTSQQEQPVTGGVKRTRSAQQDRQQQPLQTHQQEQPRTGGTKRMRTRAQVQSQTQQPTVIAPFQQQSAPPPPTPFQLTAPIVPFQQPPSPNPYASISPFGYPTPDGLYPTEMTPIIIAPQPPLPLSQTAQPNAPMQHQPAPQQQQQQQTQISQQKSNHPSFNDLDSQTLDSLYGGKQCSNCSLRFDDSNKYANHLDWHYRQNLKSDSAPARRKWYYPLNLWIQFREINDDDVNENINSDNNNANDLLISQQNDHEVPTAPASKEDTKNICSVCQESFEKFWAEEEEEWRLRNARLHDDQRVYHPLCLIDMLQASAAQSSN